MKKKQTTLQKLKTWSKNFSKMGFFAFCVLVLGEITLFLAWSPMILIESDHFSDSSFIKCIVFLCQETVIFLSFLFSIPLLYFLRKRWKINLPLTMLFFTIMFYLSLSYTTFGIVLVFPLIILYLTDCLHNLPLWLILFILFLLPLDIRRYCICSQGKNDILGCCNEIGTMLYWANIPITEMRKPW